MVLFSLFIGLVLGFISIFINEPLLNTIAAGTVGLCMGLICRTRTALLIILGMTLGTAIVCLALAVFTLGWAPEANRDLIALGVAIALVTAAINGLAGLAGLGVIVGLKRLFAGTIYLKGDGK